jgi:hypothetical protein
MHCALLLQDNALRRPKNSADQASFARSAVILKSESTYIGKGTAPRSHGWFFNGKCGRNVIFHALLCLWSLKY